MKRNEFLVLLVIATLASTSMARGFGGGLGGAAAGRGRGFAAGVLSGADAYGGDGIYGTGGLPWEESFPGIFNPGPLPGFENSSGTGFDPPQSMSGARSVNQEMQSAAPQVNPAARLDSFAREASDLGIHVGGFSAGEFGPVRGLPTDMGMQQPGTLAVGGNSAADLRLQGNIVRNDFKKYDTFGQNWYREHAAAWRAGSRLAAWKGATWDEINQWFGGNWDALSYDYGTDLTYANNTVYLIGRPYAMADKYFQRAAELARTGEQAKISADAAANWLSLGVFEAIPPNKKSSKMLMQLAVNKDGIIRGNYYDTDDQNVQRIEGSIDKDIARAVWVVADRKEIMFDTSLYNLTRRELAVLVHNGKDKNERWVLVRLQQPANASR